MGYNITWLRKVCSSFLSYTDEKKGVLDAKGVADLKAIAARLDALDSGQLAAMESVADRKATLAKGTKRLNHAILRTRRILEAAAIGNPAGSSVPRSTQGMFSISRIQATALNHRQALDKVTADVVSREVGRELNEAIAEFAKAYEAMKSARGEWRGKKNVNAQELATIRGKLWAYRTFAAYNVPVSDRRDLRTRLKYVAPEKTTRQKSDVEVTSDGTAVTPSVRRDLAAAGTVPATVATPSLPAIPSTPVPPSSEHPIMSANA